MNATPDLKDPRWLPFDIDLVRRLIQWLDCDEALIRDSSFLDTRMHAAGRQTFLAPLADIAALPPPVSGPTWLWHTSFCGSTLLARLLHLSPYALAMREPLVLRRLSDARASGLTIEPWLNPLVGLLARPWHPGGRVVVKPTHAALNIAVELIECTPSSRSVVLTSSLEEFLVSHLKKMPETLARIGMLTERALRAGALPCAPNAPAAFRPPTVLAAAALQWCVQRELVQDLLDASAGRAMVLHWATLRRDMHTATASTAAFLGLDFPDYALRQHVAVQATRHAKAPQRRFDLSTFEAEAAALRGQYSDQVNEALLWAEQNLFDLMRPESLRL